MRRTFGMSGWSRKRDMVSFPSIHRMPRLRLPTIWNSHEIKFPVSCDDVAWEAGGPGTQAIVVFTSNVHRFYSGFVTNAVYKQYSNILTKLPKSGNAFGTPSWRYNTHLPIYPTSGWCIGIYREVAIPDFRTTARRLHSDFTHGSRPIFKFACRWACLVSSNTNTTAPISSHGR
ncbi:hypothetical protein PABG_02848 [Paracoccidioides brasiliensis Pb03]|nr:hypothetical protein PABG_02848 [Paracoccidioides brasiliensis Pb03]